MQLGKKMIIGISGEMGAGKSTLVSELLAKGMTRLVNFRTYSLVNRYPLALNFKIYHVDLYRLRSADEIDSSGFWSLFQDDVSCVINEWKERAKLDELQLVRNKIVIQINRAQESNNRIYQLITHPK